MKAGIPPDLDIGPGWLLEFVAISPTDGSAVANVTVSSGTLTVQNVGGGNLAELLVLPPVLEFLDQNVGG